MTGARRNLLLVCIFLTQTGILAMLAVRPEFAASGIGFGAETGIEGFFFVLFGIFVPAIYHYHKMYRYELAGTEIGITIFAVAITILYLAFAVKCAEAENPLLLTDMAAARVSSLVLPLLLLAERRRKAVE